MRLNTHSEQPVHLGYCTNIHAGDEWADHFAELQRCVPEVRDSVAPAQPFGLGLRVSAASLATLRVPEARAELRHWLQQQNLYLFTINGFPYGTFHGKPVKADVYRPDWSVPQRLDYTCRLADLLAECGPPEHHGSISTVPGTFRAWATDRAMKGIVDNLLKCVAYCVRIEQQRGVRISIALEPEPACLLETVDDVIDFFEQRLYVLPSIERLARLGGLSSPQAETALRRHLGVCYDICHAAVEFEDPLAAIDRLQGAGIPIIKLQLSSALDVQAVDEASLAALKGFDEPIYLHQVLRRSGSDLVRHDDLGQAMQAWNKMAPEERTAEQWRVHFHVPVFLDTLEQFGTTQADLARVLERQAVDPIAPHLEVETYTWDVLPQQYRSATVQEAIARELSWVAGRLRIDGAAIRTGRAA